MDQQDSEPFTLTPEQFGELAAPQEPARPRAAQDASSAPVSKKGPWIQWHVPRGFEWNRYDLPIPALPFELEGLRIVQISDLHLKAFWSDVFDTLIDRVRTAAPDLILITGDFVDNKRNHLPAVPTVRRLVSQFKAPLGVFAILGNHDRYAFPPRLDGTGVTLLNPGRQIIHVGEAELELIGLPGVHRKDVTAEVLSSFPPKQRGVPRLVLSHFPDVLRKAAVLQPDIYFAGHTHGGQICLPGGFPLIRHDKLPRDLCKGIHRAAGTWLVVSRGFGFTGIPLRLFCPGEIVEITLTR